MGLNGLLMALVLMVGLGGGLYLLLQHSRAASRQGEALIQQATQREAQWRQVAPGLVQYQPGQPVATGLTTPRGIALTPEGDLVVVGDQVLRVVRPAGQVVREVALPATPTCVAVAADGTCYVGLKDHVATYDAAGKLRQQWPAAAARSYLTSIAVDGPDVFVGDAGQRVVLRYDVSGHLVGRLGQKDPARKIPGLVLPSPHLDVAVGADGRLRVTNPGRRRVEVYDRSGNLQASWGKSAQDISGFAGCCNPTDLALLPDGRVITAEKGLPRVKVYDAPGTLQAVVAPPEALSSGAGGRDVVVDKQGRVLVLDPPAKVVRVFAPAAAKDHP